jgi:hypothetical protein
MEPVEYDVYICCREPSGTDLAKLVSVGLTRRGFRVFFENRVPGSSRDERRLKIIEETPDFVLLLTPGALDPCADEQDPMRLEIAHALRTESNVVPVSVPGHVRSRAGALPPDLSLLARHQGMAYDPGRSHESIARLAHMLSSDAAVDERRLMRQAKRVFVTVGLAILALIGIEIARALPTMLVRPIDTRPLPPLALYWSGFGQRLDKGRWVEFTLQDGSPMFSGDQFRLVFSPSADGFAYVVSRDLRGEISVLFPALAVEADSRVRAGELYEAPVDTGWFTVDEQAGLHTIYVLASYEPIENLEELIGEPDGAMNTQARRSLVESTIAGLLDGRHAPVGRGVRARSGRPILQGLEVSPGPPASSATLASGEVVQHGLTAQPGLLSAVVELRVRYKPTRARD